MRILYLDLDTLRPDHLGCYGYHRDTSPSIDSIAAQGTRFEACYVSDAPCLPSRSALYNGRFGIHTGVVGHGGTAADLRIEGASRSFAVSPQRASWPMVMQRKGLHTVSISPFAQRHSAWWFYNGFREMHNTGKNGGERADEITPLALDWIKRNADRDDWFLHVNFWDPHTPYRTPDSYGNPFENDPPPDWLTEEQRQVHFGSYGPHSAQEPTGWQAQSRWPRVPAQIDSMAAYKQWIDGYDTGIRYMDEHVGHILEALEAKGVLDETAIMVSADHGENQGELNVYGDHQTADHITSRVPLIVRWPGVDGPQVDRGLHYQTDMAATVLGLLDAGVPQAWDGESFADALRVGEESGREFLVFSQCAWSCQRAVRMGPWVMVRTYHDGFKDFPRVMLFNIDDDPHETRDLAESRPDIANECLCLLGRWHADMMDSSDSAADPLWTVMQEGGPLHVRAELASYCERLRATGRVHHAEALERRHGARCWR